MKPIECGQASLTGLISAITARSGFKPPDDGLAGENGFFQMGCLMAQNSSGGR